MSHNTFEDSFGFFTVDEGLRDARDQRKKIELFYGIEYLDAATEGIRHSDFIIIGAKSGAGKTQVAKIIAQTNTKNGKKVALFSLESEKGEYVNRALYSIFANKYYNDKRNYKPISYRKYIQGEYDQEFVDLIAESEVELVTKSPDLKIFERTKEGFGVDDFIVRLNMLSRDTDLVIVDHITHFDFESDNEIKELKQAVKTMRDSGLIHKIPIIVVSHFKKLNRKDVGLIADLEEFYGSSEITKEATQVIVISPFDETTEPFLFPTLFKVAKLRIDGSVQRFVGKQYFNTQINGYENGYSVYTLKKSRQELEPIPENRLPFWAKVKYEENEVPF